MWLKRYRQRTQQELIIYMDEQQSSGGNSRKGSAEEELPILTYSYETTGLPLSDESALDDSEFSGITGQNQNSQASRKKQHNSGGAGSRGPRGVWSEAEKSDYLRLAKRYGFNLEKIAAFFAKSTGKSKEQVRNFWMNNKLRGMCFGATTERRRRYIRTQKLGLRRFFKGGQTLSLE